MYPCLNPSLCGVRTHRKIQNCKASHSNPPNHNLNEIIPIPSLSTPAKDESVERAAFIFGGEISQEWYESGQLMQETWSLNYHWYHREDGPAIREWSKDGRLQRELWYLNDKLFRYQHEQYLAAKGSGFTDEMSQAWAGLE